MSGAPLRGGSSVSGTSVGESSAIGPARADGPAVDYLIVGAGTAGCVLANRLSADAKQQVLLLEAGGGDSHPYVRMPMGFIKALQRPELTWGLHSEPEPQLNGRRIALPRGKLLGGSSSINGLFHIRGHRAVFDEWARAGCIGWAYDEVLPYFIRSESSWRGQGPFHGAAGPLRIKSIDTELLLEAPLREAARLAGYGLSDDYDGEQQDGMARGEVNIDAQGRRHSSARAYLHPVRDRANLKVETRAQARRILFEGGRAIGVEFEQAGRLRQVRARREVILCGGAYHSPHLLLLSGVGPGADLRKLGIEVVADRPGVGGNLIEHPRMPLQFRTKQPITFINQLRFDRAVVSALRWALTGSGPFANQICSGTVLLRTDPEMVRPDFQLLCNPIRLDAGLWFPAVKRPAEHSLYVTVCQLQAKSRGRVSLRSADPGDAPKIELGLFTHQDDFANMRAGVRAARALYAQDPLRDLIAAETLPGGELISDQQLDDSIRALGGITHHPVGTCAMGVGPQAVVDAHLRVYGVLGLRVVDASVMPSIPGANTNAATVMIAEKAADLIRQA